MTAYFEQGIDTEMLGSAIEVTLTEVGGVGATGTATLEGGFFHQSQFGNLDDGFFSLPSTLASALTLIGTAAYTVTFNDTTGKYTITRAAGGGVTSFSLAFAPLARRVLGFGASVSLALSYTSASRCDYYIIGAEGGVTEYSKIYEIDSDLVEELVADDGTPGIIAKSGAAKGFDLEVPYEPAASIWRENAGGLWCWEDFFAHNRTGAPFVIRVAGLVDIVALQRKDRAAFRPKLLGDGYIGHASILVSGFYLGGVD